MPLKMGVGDPLTVCKSTLDFCGVKHDHELEIQSVIAEMKAIRAHLKMGVVKAFATARPDM